MKRNLHIYNWLSVLIIMICYANAVFAQTTEVMDNGIRYSLNIDDKTAQVLPNNCSYSGDIVIPETVVYEGAEYSVTSLGDCSFLFCSSLTSITLSAGIISLGDLCFYECGSLANIILPESVTTLGEECFKNCHSLTNISLPKNVTTLGEGCFESCTNLISISIPENIISLGDLCFYGCI